MTEVCVDGPVAIIDATEEPLGGVDDLDFDSERSAGGAVPVVPAHRDWMDHVVDLAEHRLASQGQSKKVAGVSRREELEEELALGGEDRLPLSHPIDPVPVVADHPVERDTGPERVG